MPLFQQSVLSKYLEALPKEEVYAAWGKFTSHFQDHATQQNISKLKEEEYQEGFLRDLFVKVFGYILKPQPDFNLVLEQKSTSDTTKSDGAIITNGVVTGVIELKDTRTTDLKTVEKQAFGYKHQHKDCRYVIISNFRELRLYIDDAVEFESFDLFYLDKVSFDIMYCCLHQDAIAKDVPLKMKQLSIAEEENVTKKLYADYSRFRSLLYANITSLNPQFDRLELFKKTQKLLDRFLFILFAEDRSLLTPNSVRIIMKQWQSLKDMDSYVPLYERFKRYFGYMNTGYTGKDFEVYPYNGGLFAPDEVLDAISIDDELLYDSCMSLSNYNFMSEVDVNILGHIFEHSLTEFEKIQKELETDPDVATKPLEKNKTRRKKEGVYYTPRYITKYIVENTVGALCQQNKAEMQIIDDEYIPQKKKADTQRLAQKIEDYRNWLLQLTICDPACGSGAFLNQALEFLIQEHHSIDVLKAKLLGTSFFGSDVGKSILENNLFGVDINEEAVEIAKLSLWLRTAQRNRKLNDLSRHIKCGNSLIDDPAVAGDKAFNWQNEFPEVFAKGGFDVVIGNPPYVRQELLGDYKDYFSRAYSVFNLTSDLFAYFYELAYKIMKQGGFFSFISNTFERTTSGINLRRYLQSKIQFVKYIDFTSVQIFGGATTYPIILVGIKTNKSISEQKFIYKKIPSNSNPSIEIESSSDNFLKQSLLDSESWNFKSRTANDLLLKLKSHDNIRTNFGKCYYGIKTGFNEAFIVNGEEKSAILKLSPRDEELIKPFYEGKDLAKWNSLELDKYILFTKRGVIIENYPGIHKWLSKFRNKLEPKNQIGMIEGRKPGPYKWYEIQDTVDYFKLFEKPKIVWSNLQANSKFCWDEKGFYINAPSVILPTNKIALLGIINSKVAWFFLSSISAVRSGGFIEVKPQYFEQIPIPKFLPAFEETMINKVDLMINQTIEIQKLTQSVILLLTRKYDGLKLVKKLQNWTSLPFKEFLSELDKQKIKLTIPEQLEWMQYFEAEKSKANAIQDLIDRTDKEIDQIVYELYGLTEEEVRVVEGEL